MANNTPEVRFEGFSGEWDKKIFSDFTKLSQGLQIAISNRFTENGPNREFYITNEFLNPNNTKKYFIESPSENVKARESDILMTRTGNTGKVVTNVKGAFHNNFFKIAYDAQQTSKLFLYFLLTSDFIQKEILIRAGTSTIPDLNHNDFYKIDVQLPFIEEQTKIGSFFKQLDDSIALQQQELDTLKQTKQGFLQKMFPKEGETVPEVRFPWFSGNWEERNLGEVSERVRGNDGRMELPTLTISASSGWLDQRVRFSENIAGKEQKNYTLLKKGQLSYNHGNSKLAKYGVVFELDNYDEALVPRVYHSFKVNNLATSKFIEYMFATKRPDRELGKLVSSGARMDGLLNINYEEFMGIKILIPSIEEQAQIGSFFKQLDDTIALHHRELDAMKETKKAFLQKMFV